MLIVNFWVHEGLEFSPTHTVEANPFARHPPPRAARSTVPAPCESQPPGALGQAVGSATAGGDLHHLEGVEHSYQYILNDTNTIVTRNDEFGAKLDLLALLLGSVRTRLERGETGIATNGAFLLLVNKRTLLTAELEEMRRLRWTRIGRMEIR